VSLKEEAWLDRDSGLVGILTHAGATKGGAAVVLLNSGLVYRAGPARLYVRLARRFAAAGLPALRLDFSGIGDSAARADSLTFAESAPLEAARAMDWLTERLGVTRFLLTGICSGARVSFRAALRDERVVGIGLLNPRGLGDEDFTELREVAASYDAFRVFGDASRWKRLLTGRIDYASSIRNLIGAVLRMRRKQEAVAQASAVPEELGRLLERGVEAGIFFSEREFGRTYLRLALGPDYDALLAHPHVTEHIIPEADHTFTWPESQDAVVEALLRWSARWVGGGAGDGIGARG